MPTSHDRKQDQHLTDLDTEVANIRKKIQSNVRTMNKIAKDVNARLAALEQSGQPAPAPPQPRARHKTGVKK